MDIENKISSFVNKAQTKIRDISKLLTAAYDYSGYQSKDSKELLIKLYETRNFVYLLSTPDRGGLSNKEINNLIDFFWKWLELNKTSFVSYPNLTNIIQQTTLSVAPGTYALQADLISEIQARIAGDGGLSNRVTALENQNTQSVFPEGFFDGQNASNVNVWNDDTRLHTHANKAQLDQITAGLIAALQALSAHYASAGNPSGVHVSNTDRTAWNAMVTQAQLSALSSVYAPITHTQSGSDKHTISQITGLESALAALITDISNMAGQDGREIELQGDGNTIEWRYSGDVAWISLGTFKGDQGETGDPFTIDYRGPSSGRLSSAFNGEPDGFTYLETDTGYVYFRYPAGGAATSSAGWNSQIKFVGDNGWSPVLGVYEVSAQKSVLEVIDWVGGSGAKPYFDPGAFPPNPVRWFIGPAGLTLSTMTAINIRGPQSPGSGPVIGAAGPLSSRGDYDSEPYGFNFLQTDISPQVLYQKRSNTPADWGGPYTWQGPGTIPLNTIVDCGAADLSGGNMPTLGGTGVGGVINRGNQFDVGVGGTITGWDDPIPTGATIRAKIDEPGNTEANWRVYY
jgi:hypothetical protein